LFVPEAFTDTGSFDTAAANMAEIITTSTTYGAHASAFNMYRQEFTSATSTIPAFGQPPPNTAFAMQKSMGDGRCITTQGALPTATATKLAQGIRASSSTVVVVIVNTTDYGGCATSFGIAGAPHYITVTRNSAAAKVVLHELGHSLIGLADEYPYGTCNLSAAESPNTSAQLMALPWKDLVMDQLPTPVGTAGVGAFVGAKYCMSGVYRPTDEGCLMRRLDRDMCPVCAREVTRTFSGRDSMVPAGADGGAAPANDSGLTGSLVTSSTPLVCPSRKL
jgi:hypothetical protein